MNQIAKRVVDGKYDFWLTIDDDNPPVGQNPLDLIERDFDIIGLPTPVWHNTGKSGERPIYLNAYDASPGGYKEHLPHDGLQRVDAVGSGCMIVARRVLEHHEMQYPFKREWSDDGIVERGADLEFCRRAKKAGFHVWADYDRMCDQFSEVSLLEAARAMSQMNE